MNKIFKGISLIIIWFVFASYVWGQDEEVEKITDSNFKQHISKGVVVVKFTAKWSDKNSAYDKDVLGKIGQINPNLIAITGDLIDGSVKHLRNELEPLKDMIAEFGTYFVTGNHEYYSGVDSWLEETDRLGMINLINTNKIISKSKSQIAIAGITDFRAHQIK